MLTSTRQSIGSPMYCLEVTKKLQMMRNVCDVPSIAIVTIVHSAVDNTYARHIIRCYQGSIQCVIL